MSATNEIIEALNFLHHTYPDERVDIWASCQADKAGVVYTATVQSPNPPTNFETSVGWPLVPMQAAQNLVERAGNRSRYEAIVKRIAALQKELAELEKAKEAV